MPLQRFHRLLIVIACCAATLALNAQQAPTAQEAQQLYGEIPGLMEATAIVVPELARAGAPLTENVKQASQTLLSGPARDHVGLVLGLLPWGEPRGWNRGARR